MALLPKRYEILIRLYTDKDKKALYRFVQWHTWAWGSWMARLFAWMEGCALKKEHAAVKAYTVEIVNR